MNDNFAALADLVGQLLAVRWIEEQDEAQHHDQQEDHPSAAPAEANRPPDHDAGDSD